MTRTEFYDFADVWYQRTHKLRCVWQDKNETNSRRIKAYYLWFLMARRVLHLADIAKKAMIIQPKNYDTRRKSPK